MSKYKKRGKNKKQLRVVILSTVFILLFITTGYAAISTNITLNAKGNIVQLPKELSEITKDVVTSGDGLYQDTVENDRYIYKGANPDNYIKFNGDETWRIYSIESDGSIKIVKDESIEKLPFDPGYAYALSGVTSANSIVGTRYSNVSGDYCYYNSGNENQYYSCNSWGSKTTTLDSSGVVTTKQSREAGDTSTTYTLPESESYLNVYLNHQFNNAVYKGLNSAKTGYEEIPLPSYYTIDSISADYIKTATWNIGSPGYAYFSNSVFYGSETSIKDMKTYEEYYKWNGKVGLLTATEYMRANSNTSDNCSTFKALQINAEVCKTTNYLDKGYFQWLLSPHSDSTLPAFVLYANSAGFFISDFNAHGVWNAVRPSVYLCSGITLKGEGTSANPYTIQGNCKE